MNFIVLPGAASGVGNRRQAPLRLRRLHRRPEAIRRNGCGRLGIKPAGYADPGTSVWLKPKYLSSTRSSVFKSPITCRWNSFDQRIELMSPWLTICANEWKAENRTIKSSSDSRRSLRSRKTRLFTRLPRRLQALVESDDAWHRRGSRALPGPGSARCSSSLRRLLRTRTRTLGVKCRHHEAGFRHVHERSEGAWQQAMFMDALTRCRRRLATKDSKFLNLAVSATDWDGGDPEVIRDFQIHGSMCSLVCSCADPIRAPYENCG